MLPPVSAPRVRRRDLYQALRTAILGGVVAPGERLPSSRQAAADYGVSRGMVEETFAQLTEEGFLRRSVGRGTFVSERVRPRLASPLRRSGELRPPSPRGGRIAALAACREPAVGRAFNAGVADAREFPWKLWQRLQARACRESGLQAMALADPRGVPELRRSIARHLAQFRGIRCRAENVIIFNSAQQAIHLLATLLLEPGEQVWVEDPGYPGARAAIELAGARAVPIPVDEQGIRVEVGVRRAPRARMAYVTPPHQYPTGVILDLDRRLALLEWAGRSNAWLIEDDYDGEFRYSGQPLTTLHALDPGSRVLYIGTLSKATFLSLRLAYAVVPEELVEPLANLRTQLDGFSPALPQLVAGRFMEEGHFSSHLRRMRAIYGAKRSELVLELEPLSSAGWRWSTNPAGLHLLLSHDSGELVRRVAARSALDLALLGAYRVRSASDDGLFLRFGGLPVPALRAAIPRLLADIQGS
jgi:GntR family transcriptional regulator / MocR family aminotransferase